MKQKIALGVLCVLLLVNAQSQNAVVNWAKQMGGDWITETALQTTAVDATGNIYIAGTFVGTADFDPGPGVYNLTSAGISNSVDAYILKLDAAGNFLWVKQIENEHPSQAFSIVPAPTGEVYISGMFRGNADLDPGPGEFILPGPDDGFNNFLLKLSGNGDFIWAKEFTNNFIDYITTDNNGFIYGTGGRNSTLSKITPEGNLVWERHLGSPGNPDAAPARGTSVAIDNFGNVYGAGVIYGDCDFDPGAGELIIPLDGVSGNGFIWKLDNDGNFIWVKKFEQGYSEINSITTDINGHILTAGFFDQPVDFDPGTGTFILDAPGGRSYQHMFVSKLDNNGNFIWAKPVYGNATTSNHVIKTDAQGNSYISGTFLMTYDFDPGPASYELYAQGSTSDIFLLKLNSSGDFVWARSITGCSPNESYGMALDASNNIFITGTSVITSKFDNIIFTEANNSHFIAKLSQNETPQAPRVSLNSKIWNDLNRNGIDNNEPGIPNLVALLYQDNNNDNIPDGCFFAMTYSDAGGNISFSNLPEGNYLVEVFLPPFEGYTVNPVNGGDPDNNIDGDNNGTLLTFYEGTAEEVVRGKSVTLTAGGEPGGLSINNTYDIGLIKWELCIGNRVFNDINKNGKDDNEPGLSNVTVRLFSAPCKNAPISAATEINGTTTDETGLYGFCNLKPGYYIVSVDLPEGYTATKNGVKKPDNNKDKDNNGAYYTVSSAWGGTMTLTEGGEPEGNINNTYDFALHVTGCGDDDEEDEDEEENKTVAAVNVSEAVASVNSTSAIVYPNPFTDKIQVTIQNENAAAVFIRIYTTEGTVVRTDRKTLAKGSNTIAITGLEKLAGGMYFIEIKTAEKKITKKIIKL